MSRKRIEGVKIEGSRHFSMLPQIEPVITDYARKYRLSVYVSCPHGSRSDPVDISYDLNILFWSKPRELSWVSSGNIYRAYRYRLKGDQRDGYKLSSREMYTPAEKIIDSEGNVLALIEGNALYILFDLAHNRGETDDNYAAKILERLLADYELFRSNKRMFERKMKEREQKTRSSELVQLYKMVFHSNVGKNSKILNDRVVKTKAELLEEVSIRNKLLLGRRGGPEILFDEKRVKEIYEGLCQISDTGKIEMINQVIKIPLGQYEITHDGEIYDIGYLVIMLDLLNEKFDESLICINTTRDKEDHAHPHVYYGGEICLGNLSDGVRRLFDRGDYVSVVLVLKDFLRTYNAPDCCCNIDNWSVITVREEAENEYVCMGKV